MDPALVRIGLLDGFSVHRSDRSGREVAVPALPHGVQRLLAHLCLSCVGLPGGPARHAVAGTLWPDVPQERADRNLRSALWRLQKALPGVVGTGGGALAITGAVTVDVWELDGWARRVLDPGTGTDEPAVPESAWRGELLPGWFDDWVLVERERLRQLRVYAVEALAEGHARAGRFALAVQAAYAAVRAEPLRESAHRTLVRVHLAEGNAADALRAYECYRERLAGELGLPPSPRMRRLVEDLAG